LGSWKKSPNPSNSECYTPLSEPFRIYVVMLNIIHSLSKIYFILKTFQESALLPSRSDCLPHHIENILLILFRRFKVTVEFKCSTPWILNISWTFAASFKYTCTLCGKQHNSLSQKNQCWLCGATFMLSYNVWSRILISFGTSYTFSKTTHIYFMFFTYSEL
jgi:hypothetical protein